MNLKQHEKNARNCPLCFITDKRCECGGIIHNEWEEESMPSIDLMGKKSYRGLVFICDSCKERS